MPPHPLLYNNPVPLDAVRHANLRLAGNADLRFARPTNAIPINLPEFPQAARCYPIGFIGGGQLYPVAIVGLRQDNLFVDDQGRWKAGAFVPAYIRRYPFILGEGLGDNRMALCIDDAPSVMSAVSGAPLFEYGQPSAATRQALEFCQAYHAAGLATRAFTQALIDAGLLVERRVDATLTTGDTAALTGFNVVDPDKLQALAAKTLGQWNGRNWLAPLYAHIQSMNNWSHLVDLLAERPLAGAA